MIDLSEYSKPGRCGPATEGPLEGIGSNEVRARGRLPPFQKKLLFYATFLYITLCTRKGGISRSLSAQSGRNRTLSAGGRSPVGGAGRERDCVAHSKPNGTSVR